MNKSVFTQRIQALRATMLAQQVQACVVLSSDPHLSEYLPEHWQARQWLSGFDGSAGTLVVTADVAGLWTDSRYWEQAVTDLEGTGIVVMRAGAPDVLGPAAWLAANLPLNSSVAVDGRTLAVHTLRQWADPLAKQGLTLRHDLDLPGAVWEQRPALPQNPVYEHLPPFACRSRAENLAAIRVAMDEKQADWHWISALDEIAWLFNLRGSDVPYNPVFLAHALVGKDTATLFVGQDKVSSALQDALLHDGVKVQPYEQAITALAALPASQALLLDPARTTITMQAAATAHQIETLNPAQLLKSRKTDQEAQHVRRAMEQDGAALCQFFAWLEVALDSPDVVTELTIDQEITRARSQRNGFVSPSFSTIAAFNANGAMPHYHATELAHAVIEGNGLLLIDSGGQYLGGTTDITRMVAIGQVSPQQQQDCTVVLKGMIALSQAVFPAGTPAPLLDTVARMPIWQAGADYGHGTGHGVGYFLNVHEGPQSISYRTPATPQTAMLQGMITSNEPGLYRPGQWGVRIENLVLAVADVSTEFGDFLKFETLTLCPIDTRCLAVDMLSATERNWLNNYHAQVRERLLPLVDGMAADWLVERTLPV
ncbi:MAG: aminopeptidase P family protein [Burkholderiaceae bacterium]|nr:aminopeptidase P family protein [Burkholderiaceae bacterium]